MTVLRLVFVESLGTSFTEKLGQYQKANSPSTSPTVLRTGRKPPTTALTSVWTISVHTAMIVVNKATYICAVAVGI